MLAYEEGFIPKRSTYVYTFGLQGIRRVCDTAFRAPHSWSIFASSKPMNFTFSIGCMINKLTCLIKYSLTIYFHSILAVIYVNKCSYL